MKYLTKEWLIAENLSLAFWDTKVSKNAEQENEKYFQKRYRECRERYRNNERNAEWYRSPQEDLKKVEEYVAEPNISNEERARREKFKQDFLYINQERIEKGTVYPFDESLFERCFENEMAKRVALYRHLPPDILSKIADIRLFALGYASAEVRRLLKSYCAQLRKECKALRNKARAETERAEQRLNKRLNVNEYGGYMMLMGSEKRGGDIYLEFDGGEGLLIKEGRVLEGENHRIFRYDADVPNSAWSRIAAAELHETNGNFELHLLLSDCDEQNASEVWCYTVCGSSICAVEHD